MREREKKMKKIKNKKNQNKEFITHGVFIYEAFDENKILCRNTNKALPLPLKFRELLEIKYLRWWHIKTTIIKWGRKIKMQSVVDQPVEFVINHIPDKHLTVISICHPSDQFKRRAGVKIVKQRMKWALTHKKEKKNWKYQLK